MVLAAAARCATLLTSPQPESVSPGSQICEDVSVPEQHALLILARRRRRGADVPVNANRGVIPDYDAHAPARK